MMIMSLIIMVLSLIALAIQIKIAHFWRDAAREAKADLERMQR